MNHATVVHEQSKYPQDTVAAERHLEHQGVIVWTNSQFEVS